MLELAILGLLHESPLHGYELRQRLKATLGSFRKFSYGSLYPTLRQMKDAGWIAEDEGDPEVVAGAPAGCDADCCASAPIVSAAAIGSIFFRTPWSMPV